MSRNWKLLAAAHGHPLTDSEIEAFTPSLDALISALPPLLATLPLETEPAFQLSDFPQ